MARPPLQALLVEDNPGDARLIREMLRDASGGQSMVEVIHVDRLAAAIRQLEVLRPDVVLLDLTLPDSSGLSTFSRLHPAAPGIPIVVLSGLDDQSLAVQAVQAGAQDYLVKGQVDGGSILRALRYAIERQRLEATRQELERQRDEFFASVSHDLRTPVAAIKAAIGVVLANEPANMPPALHRLLSNIDLAADELGQLIEDLLEIARLQAGRVELWKTRVDLRDAVPRAIQPLEPLIANRQQRLQFNLPQEPVHADVDVQRFGRVMRNLVENAQKYGLEGGRITVDVERVDDAVRVTVADDGPGITSADLQHIFERFYRARGAEAEGTPGTGLGLPIARGLIELHGGSLSVDSEVGRGSTFTILLPSE